MSKKYSEDCLGLDRYRGLTLEQLFVQLCAWTTPYGSEWMLMSFFPPETYMDMKGNIHFLIREKDGSEPIVQFCSHMDTACTNVERVYMERDGDIIKTDGTTVLGADCKIGVAIMLKLAEAGVPGWYIFHVGEERGCVGARYVETCDAVWKKDVPKISIEFDRHSYGSIITHQRGDRCCSEEFSKALGAALGEFPQKYGKHRNYKSDNGGLFTDNACYMEKIPEVTNLSVGYTGHHTNREQQDITYAEILLQRIKKVNWHKLPIARDPKVKESKWSTWTSNGTTTYATKRYWDDKIHGDDTDTGSINLRKYREQHASSDGIGNQTKLDHDVAVAQKLVEIDKKIADGKKANEAKTSRGCYFIVVDCPKCHKAHQFTPGELLSGKIFLCQDCSTDLQRTIDEELDELDHLNSRYAGASSGIMAAPTQAKNLLK